jgi:hypothetical protein
MNAGRPPDEHKERQWREHLRDWRASGLSVRALCERHGLAEPSFYAWRRKLARRAAPPPAFVAVRVVADQATAPGVALEAAADGEDGPLQFRRGALGDVVVGPGQVVEALGAALQVATPPLVEPGLDAPQGRADVVDGAAGEAETDGALARREFVVHGLSSAGQPLAVACGGLSRRDRASKGKGAVRSCAGTATDLHDALSLPSDESSTMR